MAIVEIWWGSTNYGPNPGLKVELGPAGYALGGNLGADKPATIVAHYAVGADRMKFGNPRCASQPTALFSGTLTAKTGDSLLGDGDPRIKVTHVLRQKLYLGGKFVGESSRSHEVVDVAGDNKTKTVNLTPLGFDPVVFAAVPNTELRVELTVELDPWYHKTRLGGASYSALLQLPQWGLIHGI
ncbi:hypothetical protein [Nannocystis sp. SCPEA4]|uniref:hypothetical protein n=1 Tax=Nannocystis sp. SCPEA4 TaxID=2996787 RepID=UPI00226D65E3|nr:hypothetical protein [Nannocystis sp. SCPEA4]MCY1061367.1 hypothetical protein [Nannocystis sp. SCPEA4]